MSLFEVTIFISDFDAPPIIYTKPALIEYQLMVIQKWMEMLCNQNNLSKH